MSARAGGIAESSTVALADAAAAMRARGEPVVDLSAGRACEATDPEICDAGIAAIRAGDTHQTPARGAPAYLAAVAEKLERANGLRYDPAAEITATLGCKNGLVLALMTILDPGDEVIIEDPCFVSYAPTIALCGGRAVAAPLRPDNAWRWSADDLAAAITPRTRAILFCSPGNPTGVVHTPDDLEVVADAARRHDLVVIADEIYEAVTWGGRRHTPIAALPGMRERAIGLMGMTKSYAMGGWRIGYAYAPAAIAARMAMVQGHLSTSASAMGQRAAETALSAEVTERLARTLWPEWERRCAAFTDDISASRSLSVEMPEAGYYAWIDISATGLSSHDFARRLLDEERIVVVPGVTFGATADAYVRATCVKSWEDIRAAAPRIAAFADRIAAQPHNLEESAS